MSSKHCGLSSFFEQVRQMSPCNDVEVDVPIDLSKETAQAYKQFCDDSFEHCVLRKASAGVACKLIQDVHESALNGRRD